MKKLIYLFCLGITPYIIQAQSVTILPSNNNEIVVKGNLGGTTGTIGGQFTTRSSDRDAVLRTSTNHPISFAVGSQTRMRLNTGGDLGIGNEIAYSIWDGDINSSNNRILSRLHVYGVGAKAFQYDVYYPFHSAILGQAYGDVSTSTNRAGVIGVTDGKASSYSFNIGVLGMGTSDPAATSDTYSFWGRTDLSSNVAGYGMYNSLTSSGTGVLYGSYASVTASTNPASGGSSVYGAYSSTSSSRSSPLYGQYNSAFTGSAVTSGVSYGNYNTITSHRDVHGIYSYVSKSGARSTGINGSGITTNVNITDAWDGFGADFRVNNSASSYAYAYGVRAVAQNNSENGSVSYGILAEATGTNNGTKYGVRARAEGGTGTKYGIYASADGTGTRWAGYFAGNVHIDGALSKSSGTFKIDHPQDPENKYLVHSFVESPDMMNVYNGNITTDADGNATVELPKYFESLNKDFRYQLTTIGQKADAWIAEEVVGNAFRVSTDKPNVKVSWQVTGIRNDPYANQNRIVAEVDKNGDEKGKYLNPEVYNKPTTMSMAYEHTIRESKRTPSPVEEEPGVNKPQRDTPFPVEKPLQSSDKKDSETKTETENKK